MHHCDFSEIEQCFDVVALVLLDDELPQQIPKDAQVYRHEEGMDVELADKQFIGESEVVHVVVDALTGGKGAVALPAVERYIAHFAEPIFKKRVYPQVYPVLDNPVDKRGREYLPFLGFAHDEGFRHRWFVCPLLYGNGKMKQLFGSEPELNALTAAFLVSAAVIVSFHDRCCLFFF